MSQQPLISIAYPASSGVDNSDEPVFFDSKTRGAFVQQAVNLRIHKGRWRTRYRVMGVPVTGDAKVSWQAAHTQASTWYIPQSGQGTHYIGKGGAKIVESAAGRLYSLTPVRNSLVVEDISGGIEAYPPLRIAWLAVAENYVFRTDGYSQSQIWDGTGTVVRSPGYNPDAKNLSRFPNGAGPAVYAGGRVYAVVYDRRILVSDSLHQTDQVSAIDLTRFTDQSYDQTNVYFAPPTSEGDIVALGVSVSSGFDNSRAQGEVMVMCRGPGIWAIALGVPRLPAQEGQPSPWAVTNMRHSRSKETAPSGPKAFFVRDGDILMRTSRGIESLNLLAREREQLGNASIDLGAEMSKVLSQDDEEALLFASLINPIRWNRMLCTVGPVIDGSRHYHLGWIAANWNPNGVSQPNGMAWEGVQTLPKQLGRVIQFLPAVIDGVTTVMALTDREDGTSKGVVQFAQEEGDDLDDDGNAVPVEWSMTTRKLMAGGSYGTTPLNLLYGYFSDMKTDVTVQVYARDDKHRAFLPMRRITITRKLDACQPCDVVSDRRVNFGNVTKDFRDSRWVQFMFRGTGTTSLDFAIRADSSPEPGEQIDADCVEVTCDPQCQDDPFFQSR